ncbi:MAG: hypothetical protein HKL79_00055 [Thermoplasmata archaeon]|nr:hypothetical protein [Thermoplasmata archaeon]
MSAPPEGLAPDPPELPKDLSIAIVREGRQLVKAAVEFDNAPGRLADLLQTLSCPEHTLLTLHLATTPDQSTAIGHLYLEVTGAGEAADVERRLRMKPYVRKVFIRMGYGGILVDSAFPLVLSDKAQAIILDGQQASEMFARVRELMGSGGAVIVYELGKGYGRPRFVRIIGTRGVEFMDAHPEYALQMLSAMGWGKLTMTAIDREKGTATIVVEDGFECRGQKSTTPHGQFIRGVLAGGASVALGRELECEERRCIAMGDEFCEYFLRPADPPE